MKEFFKNILNLLEDYKPRGGMSEVQETLVKKVAKQIREPFLNVSSK